MQKTDQSAEDVQKVQYICVHSVSQELGVARGTVYYYIKQLHIEMHKFPLDRKAYILIEDLERMKTAKHAATQGQR